MGIMNLTDLIKQHLKNNPTHNHKEICKKHPELNQESVRVLCYRIKNIILQNVTNITELTPNQVLKEIYLDKKQPGSTRVQAIREYKTIVEIEDVGEDPSLRLYNSILEKRNLKNEN